MTTEWSARSGGQPIVLGHRGTRSTGVENTMPAFEAALREGAAGVEFDVRLDANMRVVVHHDASLERLTEGTDTRRIESMLSQELDSVRLRNGSRVPPVVEVLDWANTRGALLNIELKASLQRPATLVVNLLAAIRRTAVSVPILLSSFDPRLISKLSQLAPRYTLGWLVEELTYSDARERSWRRLGAQAVCSEWQLLTQERAQRWSADNALLVAWTVNDDRVAVDLGKRGADVIISDTPADVIAGFARASSSR